MSPETKYPISELEFDLDAEWYTTFRTWIFGESLPEDAGIFAPRRRDELLNWISRTAPESQETVTVFWIDASERGADEPDNIYGIVVGGWLHIRGEPSDTGALHTLRISMDLSYLATSAYPVLNRLDMFFRDIDTKIKEKGK